MALDQLIESVSVAGQIAAGAKRAVVAAHTTDRRLALTLSRAQRSDGKGAKRNTTVWSQADDDFLRANLGRLTLDEIARRLGRTWAAVKIRQTRELHLTAPTKQPHVLTSNMVAYGLGRDVHAIVKMIERGILPGRKWPYKHGRRCFIVDRVALAAFAVNPLNWIYFDPEQINRSGELRRDTRRQKYDAGIADWFEKLRALVLRRKALWADEWWTPGQVGEYHGTTHMNVNNAIHDGALPAVKWGNWHILRSDAVAVRQIIAWSGKGGTGQDHTYHSPASDAFLVLAAAAGESYGGIGALMGQTDRWVEYRLRTLRRRGRLPWIVRHHKLPVHFNRHGDMLADWKALGSRLPHLVRAMRRLRSGCELAQRELLTVRSVLRTWALFFERNQAQREMARGLKNMGKRQACHFREIVRQLRAMGIDPYRYRKVGGR